MKERFIIFTRINMGNDESSTKVMGPRLRFDPARQVHCQLAHGSDAKLISFHTSAEFSLRVASAAFQLGAQPKTLVIMRLVLTTVDSVPH